VSFDVLLYPGAFLRDHRVTLGFLFASCRTSNPDFKNVAISGELKELFQYITRFTPHEIELETDLKAFIPDYIPAVGDIDPFIKVQFN
jgi:hypothetical protein